MLKLYHGKGSVCSIKVRIGLAEKQLDWESCLVDLPKGEQFAPEYLRLNPNAVVPTLLDDGFVVIESSVILQYIDTLSDENILMPGDVKARTNTLVWLVRCLDSHAAINTMTFSTVGREKIIGSKTPAEIKESIIRMPNPKAASKRWDLIENGTSSQHLIGDFFTLYRLFADMQTLLKESSWLTGNAYGMTDTAILAYVDRLDRLAMSGLWEERFPAISNWLKASKSRSSYGKAIDPFISQNETENTRHAGEKIWPQVKQRWEGFLKTHAHDSPHHEGGCP